MASEDNLDVIEDYHREFGEAMSLLESRDKAEFISQFSAVSDWFGEHAQRFMKESQGLLQQASDSRR